MCLRNSDWNQIVARETPLVRLLDCKEFYEPTGLTRLGSHESNSNSKIASSSREAKPGRTVDL
jgi:hypothetical protein